MKKKILLGSIVAVVILVLVSLTGVVGYQTTSSTIAKASPLFTVRTNRAIGKESKDLTCKYVGKGITLPFPKRDDRVVMFQKVIDSISKMDDEAFERFIAHIINNAQKDKGFNGVNPNKIRGALYLLRNSDKPIPIFNSDTGNKTFNNGFKGILFCIFLLPISIILDFFIWCFNFDYTGVMMITYCCNPPPPTLRKFLP
jgi:hypothetical protein